MHWHTLALVGIPVLIFALTAGVKALWDISMQYDARWWGGFPLILTGMITALFVGAFGSIAIGAYAATGHSPFS